MTNLNDSKKGPKYEVGQHVKTYDADEEKVVNGVITEVGDDTISVKWEDLREDTEYEITDILMKDEYLIYNG